MGSKVQKEADTVTSDAVKIWLLDHKERVFLPFRGLHTAINA